MKLPNRMKFPLFLLALILSYVLFGIVVFGLTRPTQHSGPDVCIYEVVVNQLVNHINIGWDYEPCGVLDIREVEDHELLTHSSFNPVCPVFAIQTWPGMDLPVVDYSNDCSVDSVPPPREADEGDER